MPRISSDAIEEVAQAFNALMAAKGAADRGNRRTASTEWEKYERAEERLLSTCRLSLPQQNRLFKRFQWWWDSTAQDPMLLHGETETGIMILGDILGECKKLK